MIAHPSHFWPPSSPCTVDFGILYFLWHSGVIHALYVQSEPLNSSRFDETGNLLVLQNVVDIRVVSDFPFMSLTSPFTFLTIILSNLLNVSLSSCVSVLVLPPYAFLRCGLVA